jgi:hypothetical protein
MSTIDVMVAIHIGLGDLGNHLVDDAVGAMDVPAPHGIKLNYPWICAESFSGRRFKPVGPRWMKVFVPPFLWSYVEYGGK